MSPLDVPYAIAGLVAAVLIPAAVLIRQHRHHKTPASTRPAAHTSREAGTNPNPCIACGQPAAASIRAGYDTWPLCPRCREEYDALHYRTPDWAEWEREARS